MRIVKHAIANPQDQTWLRQTVKATSQLLRLRQKGAVDQEYRPTLDLGI